MDRRQRPGDLARDEGLAAALRLVVEEDAVGGVHPVGLAVVDRDPERGDLGHGVGAAGVEGRRLGLRRRRRAEHLARRGLVEARLHAGLADRLQQPHGAHAGHVARVLRDVERDAHMRLGPEVVDLVWLDLVDEAHKATRIRQIAIVQQELSITVLATSVDRIDPLGVERRGAAHDAVDLVALGEQLLGQVGAVLAGDAGDQSPFHRAESLASDDLGMRESPGTGDGVEDTGRMAQRHLGRTRGPLARPPEIGSTSRYARVAGQSRSRPLGAAALGCRPRRPLRTPPDCGQLPHPNCAQTPARLLQTPSQRGRLYR